MAPVRVLGVVPDIHTDTARRVVEPTVFVYNANWFSTAIVQFHPGTGAEVRRAVEARWTAMFPDHPFSAELLETAIDAQYRNERRLAAILTAAALLALAVACLGLYGLSSFLIESRSKEIAIRKVLGASTSDVIALLAWQLARPIALACALAAPVAYVASERWLGGFAYRISIGAGWIAGTVVTALAIAAATVALQSLRSALATPVDALRS
jgi:putative ABC transport system permease protein